MLKEHDAGAKVTDLVRKHNVNEQSIYLWRSNYGSMVVSEANRLRQLENENSRLKRLLAEAMLENAAWLVGGGRPSPDFSPQHRIRPLLVV